MLRRRRLSQACARNRRLEGTVFTGRRWPKPRETDSSVVLRLSTLFLRTLRDDPVDAEVASHKLLVRAGYIRRAAPGIYSWLPLGLRVLGKVEAIIREEMTAIGAQEVHFPALLPTRTV